MPANTTLSLCMIVKNEEKYLAQCLESVKEIVHEIIIVDTGSTDQTLKIAQKYHAKVYHYTWDDNFSHARNFAMSKASCDWLLLLDADEVLAADDKDKLLTLIKTTSLDGFYLTIYNYTGLCPSSSILTHQAFRLLRNTGEYIYTGAIHEQITRIKDDQPAAFANETILVYHYGYLKAAITQKDKRNRNIPLIEKQLESEPDDPFYLYNLGNEYIAENHFKQALAFYKHALLYASPQQGFTANLYYRAASCLLALQKKDEAMTLCDSALNLYPSFTDMVFLKGMLFSAQNKITLAIDAYKQCLSLGEAPEGLCFNHGSGTFQPLLALGDLYYQYHDYEKALDYYNQVIASKPGLYHVLYRIGKTITKVTTSHEEAYTLLSHYFNTLTAAANLRLFIDILLSIDFFDQAESCLNTLAALAPDSSDLYYLKGKLYFYTYRFNESHTAFHHVLTTESISLFAASSTDTFHYLFLLNLILSTKDAAHKLLQEIQQNTLFSEDQKQLFDFLYQIVFSCEAFSIGSLSARLPFDLSLLTSSIMLLLKIKEFRLVESCKSLLKQLAPDSYLLDLADVYFKLDHFTEAKNYVYEAIKASCPLNSNALMILSFTLDQ